MPPCLQPPSIGGRSASFRPGPEAGTGTPGDGRLCRAARTVLIATSDRGDVLGDRGTWFRMCFYERSARVPLVVAGPDVANRSVGNVCSLLDLFPTLLDIARAGNGSAAPPAGRSLWPSATGGEDPGDETTGEYMDWAEAGPRSRFPRSAEGG